MESVFIMSIFSERLEEERKLAGWTKTYTAKKLNLPLTTYANYEYGKREPDIKTITKMAVLFGTSTDYLMGTTDLRTNIGKIKKEPTTYEDLGLPYKGVISEDVNDMYKALAETYAKKHNLPKRDD